MTDRWIMDAKSLASDICSRYFSMLDSCAEHPLNVSNHLKPLVLEVTSGIITGSAVNASDNMNNVMSENSSTISKRSMARLEAFLDGVSAAIPLDPYKSAVVVPSSSASSLLVDVKSRIFPFWNNSHSPQPRRNSSSTRRYTNRYAQIGADDLILRIELYIRSVQRIYGGNTTKNRKTGRTELTETQHQTYVEECNVHQEPTRLLLRTRVDCICRAFIANVSCVTLVQPVLLRLLGSTTRELLAVQTLSEDLCKAIKRVSVEYEMKTSFASVAFLSSPEQATESVLFPLVVSYFKYLRNDWRRLVFTCQIEELLASSIDPVLRQTFKNTPFTSIGHLLHVINHHQGLLNHIPLPSFSSITYVDEENNDTSNDSKLIKQALIDLRRETITVNGILLPPAHSRKQLIKYLFDALHHQIHPATCATTMGCHGNNEVMSELGENGKYDNVNCNSASTGLENEREEAQCSTDESSVESTAASSCGTNDNLTRKKRRFDLRMIDRLTLRLMMASCRTGAGGDAFFVVQDLFGGDDVVVVPSSIPDSSWKKTDGTHKKSIGTIEIIVLLSSVVIKVHGRYNIYPKNPKINPESCEPLIQLHTTTSEKIALRTVRVCDSRSTEDNCYKETNVTSWCPNQTTNSALNSNPAAYVNSATSVVNSTSSSFVLQEQITETTGQRYLSVKPARYKKVSMWSSTLR